MTFANISFADSIATWKNRLNEHSLFLNAQVLTGNLATLRSNSSFLTIAGNTALGSTLYLNVSPTQDGTDNSTRNVASAYMVNTALGLFATGFNNQFANLTAQLTSDTSNLANAVTANTTAAIDKVTSDSANSTNTVLNLVNTVNASIAVTYGQANTAYNQANSAYDRGNTAYNQGNVAYGQANLALATAQSVYAVSNTLNSITSAQYVSNTPNLLVTTSSIWASGVEVVLNVVANTVNIDMSKAINGNVSLTANTLLGFPINVKVGQTGRIRFIQPNPGNKNVTYANVWKFTSQTAPNLTSSNGSSDILYYDVISPTFIYSTLSRDIR